MEGKSRIDFLWVRGVDTATGRDRVGTGRLSDGIRGTPEPKVEVRYGETKVLAIIFFLFETFYKNSLNKTRSYSLVPGPLCQSSPGPFHAESANPMLNLNM